jgi:uncharacterized protein YjbJ (UPF0337 family)
MGSYKEQGRGMFDQAKGKVKEEIGDATDNPRLENEGRTEKESGKMRKDVARTNERIKGTAEEMKGSVKRGVGDVLDNEQMQAEGEVEKAKGSLRRKLNE